MRRIRTRCSNPFSTISRPNADSARPVCSWRRKHCLNAQPASPTAARWKRHSAGIFADARVMSPSSGPSSPFRGDPVPPDQLHRGNDVIEMSKDLFADERRDDLGNKAGRRGPRSDQAGHVRGTTPFYADAADIDENAEGPHELPLEAFSSRACNSPRDPFRGSALSSPGAT